MKKLVYVGVSVLFIVFEFTAYRQNEKTEIYCAVKNKMHQELTKVPFEA